MSEFFKYTGESVLRSPNILVRRTDIVSIQDFCVSALGYKNINSVRDRFDGQRFMDTQIRKIGSLYALSDFFNFEKPVLGDQLISDPNPVIKIKGVEYQIISSDFGILPTVNKLNVDLDAIVTCRRDDVYFLLLGVLRKENFDKKGVFKSNALGQTFIGFSVLERF